MKTPKLQNSKFLVILLFLFSILNSGCEKDNYEDLEIESVNFLKVKSVKLINNIDEQKIAYGLLNKNEKFYIWHSKFQSIIDNNSTLNSKQIELLNELKNKLSINFFKEKSDEKEYFKNIFAPKYIEKISSEFTKRQIFILFGNISSQNDDLLATNKKNLNPGDNDCTCNVGSIVSCSFGSDDCEEPPNPCKLVRSQCGFLWAYDCNGKCLYG